MPGIGALILIMQIACAVHVARTGRPQFWIYLVVFVPVVGMAAYFFAEVLPDAMSGRTARRAAAGVSRTLDPGREIREAMRRVEITPTAENKVILAEQYLRGGDTTAAIFLYREVLTGIHATDPGMMLGLARALFINGDAAEARQVLDRLREANPDYTSPEGHLLYARSLEILDDRTAALEEYAALVTYYPGQEARYRYAKLLRQCGRDAEAQRIFREICHAIDYGPRHQFREQREWYELAKRELARAE